MKSRRAFFCLNVFARAPEGFTRFKSWRAMIPVIKPHSRQLAFGLLLTILERLSILVFPIVSKVVIDDVVLKRQTDLLPLLGLAIALATCLQLATSFFLSRLLGFTSNHAVFNMQRKAYAHLMQLPLRFHDSTKTGVRISHVTTDADQVRLLIGRPLVNWFASVLTGIVMLILMLRLNALWTGAVLLLLAVIAPVKIATARRLRPLYGRRLAAQAELAARLTDSFEGIRVVKAYNRIHHEEGAVLSRMQAVLRASNATLVYFTARTAVETAIRGSLILIILVAGARLVLAGTMTPGALVMFVYLVTTALGPLTEIASLNERLAEALAGIERLSGILALPSESEAETALERVGELRHAVSFVNVAFEYQKDMPVLNKVSFTIPVGTTTAIVGRSGAGKSTIIRLLAGLERPTRGAMLIDGRDLAAIRLHDYRSMVGAVFQDEFLFNGSIGENVCFSKCEASISELYEACRISCCEQFIDSLEEGFDTAIGERGIKLSGGQRQRLAIARAVIARPRILILDEAASNIDAETERQIQRHLRELQPRLTMIITTHRLSSIAHADQILVVDRGSIVEQGTHDELLRASGLYSRLSNEESRNHESLRYSESWGLSSKLDLRKPSRSG